MGKVKEYGKMFDERKRKHFNKMDVCKLNFPFVVKKEEKK